MAHFSMSQKTAAFALAGALLTGTLAPAVAGPVPGNVASLAKATPHQVIDVRWRHRGGAVAAGIAAGLIGGALIGAATAPYYYGPGYYDAAAGLLPLSGPGLRATRGLCTAAARRLRATAGRLRTGTHVPGDDRQRPRLRLLAALLSSE